MMQYYRIGETLEPLESLPPEEKSILAVLCPEELPGALLPQGLTPPQPPEDLRENQYCCHRAHPCRSGNADCRRRGGLSHQQGVFRHEELCPPTIGGAADRFHRALRRRNRRAVHDAEIAFNRAPDLGGRCRLHLGLCPLDRGCGNRHHDPRGGRRRRENFAPHVRTLQRLRAL